MADYTAASIDYNSGAGTDASPVWTGTTLAFGGSAGANEARWQRTGGGGGVSTGSASWPYIVRPGANALVEEMWIFTADTTGLKALGYPTTTTAFFSRAFRFNFDNLGSPASAMQLSAYQDTANTAPTPGTQTAQATDFRNIVNGQTTDTGNTSYLKGNVYGSGFPAAGAQETPAAASLSTTVAASDGTAGAISPSAAAWILTHWQSLQGATQYIQAPSIAKVLTAFFWYCNFAMFVGPNMQTSTAAVGVFANLSYTYT